MFLLDLPRPLKKEAKVGDGMENPITETMGALKPCQHLLGQTCQVLNKSCLKLGKQSDDSVFSQCGQPYIDDLVKELRSVYA
jgi:hypothetical protein